MSATQALASLKARFDQVALQAPAAAPRATEQAQQQRDPATWAQLLDWCHTPDARSGRAPWHGRASNDFSIARLALAEGNVPDDLKAWAQAFARHLDGSVALESLPSQFAGLAWRARIKLNDAMWWRPRQKADPWDAGWASTSPPAERRLQHHFLPRRATLILALAADADGLALALTSLAQRGAELQHPVRWLWVGEPAPGARPPAPHLQPTRQFSLR